MAQSPKHPASEHHFLASAHHQAAAHHHLQAAHLHDLGQHEEAKEHQLRLTNIASSPTNIRRLPTVILRRRPSADHHVLGTIKAGDDQMRYLKHDQLASSG